MRRPAAFKRHRRLDQCSRCVHAWPYGRTGRRTGHFVGARRVPRLGCFGLCPDLRISGDAQLKGRCAGAWPKRRGLDHRVQIQPWPIFGQIRNGRAICHGVTGFFWAVGPGFSLHHFARGGMACSWPMLYGGEMHAYRAGKHGWPRRGARRCCLGGGAGGRAAPAPNDRSARARLGAPLHAFIQGLSDRSLNAAVKAGQRHVQGHGLVRGRHGDKLPCRFGHRRGMRPLPRR